MGHRHGRPCSYWGGSSSTVTGITAPHTAEKDTQPGLFERGCGRGCSLSVCEKPRRAVDLVDAGDTAVLVRDEGAGEKRLVYVTGATDPADIRARLGQRLLTYVVPRTNSASSSRPGTAAATGSITPS